MVASLGGIIFDQVYGDNSGGAEFDTDGDGTTTQEDEFVSFTNNSGAPVDISGWEIWSDTSGDGAPDGAQDGLYHVFPPGTVLAPGQTLFVINEITGPAPGWAQEASEGGVESGAGGINTNFLTEGDSTASNSIALVNPATGDFLVFNMFSSPSDFSEFDGGSTGSNPSLAAFPGSTMIAEIDAASVQNDQNAGSSYQYDSGTDSYVYSATFVPCFASGTMIDTPSGPRRVEQLAPGDLVVTLDHGAVPVRLVLTHNVSFSRDRPHACRPVVFAAGSLGPGRPDRRLVLSPQHRVLVTLSDGSEALCPAKGLVHWPGIRFAHGIRRIRYVHLVFDQHEIVTVQGVNAESFFFGPYASVHLPMRNRLALHRIAPALQHMRRARPFVGAGAFRRLCTNRPWPVLRSMY